MISLVLTIALLGCSALAPLGAEPVVAWVKSAPVTQTYQVCKDYPMVIEPKDHPPITVEVGVLVNYGKCTTPRLCVKRTFVLYPWGGGQWHCLDRRGGWQICGVQ